jgi:tripartite-type tricarboxylate transporter receptor subunit TctC
MPPIQRRALGLLTALSFAASAFGARAQNSKPVRFIVPYPPGGGTDTIARLLLPAMSALPGAPTMVIENRPGAGGNVGTEVLAKSPPDGLTLGFVTIGTHGTNPWLFARQGFDPLTDFSFIALVSRQPTAVAVAADSPLRSLDDLLALKTETPAASPGNGTSGHLGVEMLRVMGRLPLMHVPYRGTGPAWADLLGGRAGLVVDNLPTAMPHHQSGRVRILAVTGTERSALLPDVPAVQEKLPGYLVESWNGIAGPAGLPAEAVARWSALIAAAARNPALRARYAELGIVLPDSSPTHLAGFVRQQMAFWQRMIAEANIRLE